MVKPCRICGELKRSDEFAKHIAHKDNLDSRCKECIAHQVKVRRGLIKTSPLAPEVCDCCGRRSEKSLVLDHCHVNNTFRGWLCEECNFGIGKLGDDIDGVKRAIEYLKRV